MEADQDTMRVQEGTAQLPQRVGVVKERCEAVKRIPLNNAVALGRKLTLVRVSSAGHHRSTNVGIKPYTSEWKGYCRPSSVHQYRNLAMKKYRGSAALASCPAVIWA